MRAKPLKITRIEPSAAIEGGKIWIYGNGFNPEEYAELQLKFGEVPGRIFMISNSRMLALVPDDAQPNGVTIEVKNRSAHTNRLILGRKLASNLHPVDNPVYDREGNLYVTFSGKRGEVVPVSVFKISKDGAIAPHLSNIANATSMAFDSAGDLFISSRFEGIVYKATPRADV